MTNQDYGLGALVLLLVMLLAFNARYLYRNIQVLIYKKPLAQQPKVLPGSRGNLTLGALFLSLGVVKALLNGDAWYSGLLPWNDGGDKAFSLSPIFLVLGYLLVAWGLASMIAEWRQRRGFEEDSEV